ncbi:MAG: hypothetical protein GQ574_18615 [Crocinitomix sp.]|nr:hypothetical protein [Crocinitomix sp.]
MSPVLRAQQDSTTNNTVDYKVVKVDQLETHLQRLFIVIDSAEVHNAKLIQYIVIEVCANYDLDSNSRLSFFCDEKYANYKDNLFMGDQAEFSITDYYKWMNFYYLAEFDFATKIYISYPGYRGKGVKGKKIGVSHAC